MSRKTFLSILVLIMFVVMAVSSGGTTSSVSSSSSSPSSPSSSGSKSYLTPTKFPKATTRCWNCYGNGCSVCGGSGMVVK
ncbi:MAG: hypothetical protein J6J76_06195 [Paraprevotella sp.]|nr:hypothetical protein [Paraprevotella sp.]